MFTKQQRQEIVADFAKRHGGHYDPRLFVEEVKSTGESHPAHGWFTWDRDRAAYEHWLWQAREFASDLKVSFTIEEIDRGKVTVREVTMPMALSPLGGRQQGGGYIISDPNSPVHMAELCLQAANDLARWLRRYEAAIIYAQGSTVSAKKLLERLEYAATPEEEEVA